jgi:hypothetical protein
MKALDQIAERMVALIRKDGWLDQCVVEPKKEQAK